MVKQLKLEAERELEDKYEILNDSQNSMPIKEEIKEEEKIVTLNSNSSSNKQIAFKKRRVEGQQQRKRTDD